MFTPPAPLPCPLAKAQGRAGAVLHLSRIYHLRRIYAGARKLVISDWPADSTATERLMTAMFSSAGDSQGDALRRAQMTMMDSPSFYSHPGCRAAFTIVGDGVRAMPGV